MLSPNDTLTPSPHQHIPASLVFIAAERTSSLKRINSFFILSGYYFSSPSSVYLFTVKETFFSPHWPGGVFTDGNVRGKELTQ